ncbi:MAG: serine/threonine protein kinase [Sandaracinaceae bacterium]|nr:serine/threonine protein kinase [Sandaracinaceae bacterium]
MSRRCPSCGTEYEDAIAFCGNDGTVTVHVQAADEEPDRRLGKHFGEYVVVQRVADGAMGRVYEGRHASSRQKVAIKVLHPDVAKDRIAVERFKREYETAKEIDSPFVVRVIDFGDTGDGSFYLTMEYLHGEELGTLLRREGAQPVARALRILCQVACGLDDAHSFGVIHRDLKPDNLFLVKTPAGDEVRILDFGSVKLQMETGPKLTAFGTTLGSPYYMSPEQAMGKADVDNRTDLFALSAITYEMLTGKIAFDGPAVAQILMKIVNDMPPPLSGVRRGMPLSLDDVIEKAIAKDKKKRHDGTVMFAADVLGAIGLLPVGAPQDRATVEAWGKKTIPELEAALATATPRAAQAFGAPAPAAPTPAATPAPGPAPYTPTGAAPPSLAPPSSNRWMVWAGLAAFGLVTLTVLGAAGAYMLGLF